MKRALAVLVFVVSTFGFAQGFVGSLTGSWDFKACLTFADVTLSEPDQTFTYPGGTFNVVGGSVTIPDQSFTLVVNGHSFDVVVPGGTYPVQDGGWSFSAYIVQYVIEDTNTGQTYPATFTILGMSGTWLAWPNGCNGTEVTIPKITIEVYINSTKVGEVDYGPFPETITNGKITIPAQTLQVPSTDYELEIPQVVLNVDCTPPYVEIPDKTVHIDLDGQTLEFTVKGGQFAVTGATVTIPSWTFTVKGWTKTIYAIPKIGITSTLTLNYAINGWTFTSVTGFGGAGLTSQKFGVKGAFGPFNVSGNMEFDPAAIAYTKSDLTLGLDLAGMGFSLKVEHWANPQSFCSVNTGANLRYTLKGTLGDASATLVFVDCCMGTQFYSLLFSLKNIGLCCGIAYDAEFSFLKSGFDYLKFTLKNVFPICCGISFDMAVTFKTTAKTVTLTPKFAGFAEACFKLYADLEYEGGKRSDLWLDAIRVDGWSIKCTILDCNYIEFLTFLSPEHAEDYDITLDTTCGEFEWIKLGFCGAGCCGGQYSVDLAIYFGTKGGLFDVTRLVGNVKIPMMANFTLNISAVIPAASCASQSICVGWTFTF